MSNLILTGDFDPAITYQTTPVSFTFNESASYEIRIDLSSDTFKNVGFVEFEFKSPQPLSDANLKYIEAYDEDGTTRIKQQETISKTSGTGWSRCRINTFYCDAASNTIYIRFIGISDDEEHTAIVKNFRFGDPDLGKSVVTIASDDELTIDPVSSNYVLDNGSGYTFSYEYATDRIVGNVVINDVYQETFSTTSVTVSSISENKEIYVETFPIDDVYYTVDITSTGAGTVYPTGHINVVENGSLFVDPTPLSGNKVSSITVDGTVYPTWIVDYTFENITDNHTIEVAFASGSPATHTITETHTDGGLIFPSGAVSTTHGKNVTYTFFPAVGCSPIYT